MNSLLFNSNDSLNLSIEELQESHLKRGFLTKIYFYFINGGFYNIIISEVTSIFTSSFLIFYTIFLYNCIDWTKLFNIDSKTKLKNLITMENYFKLNLFYWMLFIIFIFITICKIYGLITQYKEYKNIQIFYNDKLKIKDNELTITKWNNIINKFKLEYDNNTDINVYYINNKISCKDNYFITLIDKDVLKLEYLTKIMEWNIIFCILNSIFNNDIKFNPKFLNNDPKFISSIQEKLKFIAILNFVFMPFIFIFLLFYYLFIYGEKFYSNPNYIITRNWTLMAKWKLRNYNELFHEYDSKFIITKDICNEYTNLFPNKIIQTISRFLLFILSSVFVILVFISIVNERILTNLYITNNKQTIWFIGIVGSIIAILKRNLVETAPDYPKDKMKNLKEKINSIPDKWLEDAQKKNSEFFKYYQLQSIILLKDIYYTLIIPFTLYKISINTKNIMRYLNDITISTSYGHMNKYASFLNDINSSDITNTDDKKKLDSIDTFHRNYEINLV